MASVFVVYPDYGFDGYGAPEFASIDRNLAEDWIRRNQSHTEWEISELTVTDSSNPEDPEKPVALQQTAQA